MTLCNIYFSAKGTTRTCAEWIASHLGLDSIEYNWLSPSQRKPLEISADDVLLFSMPIYGGFIPHLCAEQAKQLTGHGTPAIIAAVYGNRHYDNSLLQMKDLLEARGFEVIAAGAFLAEHSIFPTVGAGRPDEKDKAAMAEFAAKCRSLLGQPDLWQDRELQVPGTLGYDALSFKGVPFKPDGDEHCTGCGQCVKVCPQNAICVSDPRSTDNDLCISCGACISVCPTGARNYHQDAYPAAKAAFEEKCAAYRTPETFYIA